MSRAKQIKLKALANGFSMAGIAAVPTDDKAPRAVQLEDWLRRDYHGPLDYMQQTANARMDLGARFPWAKSLLCVGSFHSATPAGQERVDLLAHVARYARGRDYHLVFEKSLKQLARMLVDEGLCGQARWYVDTGPILERAWAERAGLGWIGKNSCLIHPQKGSYFLLGELILDVALDADPPETDHCGSCRKCLDACPTSAFPQPGVLDARKCIVTWNLELKGEVPEAQWAAQEKWAAGCDVCQEVCPFNGKERIQVADEMLAAPLPWHAMTLADAVLMTKAEFDRAFKASALRRTGWKGIRMGAITVAGNLRVEAVASALKSCLDDSDPDIRNRARWAMARMDGSSV